MAIETKPSEKPIPPTSFTSNFSSTPPPTTNVVVEEPMDTPIFPNVSHLTTAEIKKDGGSWVKILAITAVLLLVLDAGVYGYNLWRGEQNPDLLAPIMSLLNK